MIKKTCYFCEGFKICKEALKFAICRGYEANSEWKEIESLYAQIKELEDYISDEPNRM